MIKDLIVNKLVETRYKNMPPLQVAEYFEKLLPQDKADVTAALLLNDNSLAKIKIMDYMKSELNIEIDQHITNGSIPLPIVEELLQ